MYYSIHINVEDFGVRIIITHIYLGFLDICKNKMTLLLLLLYKQSSLKDEQGTRFMVIHKGCMEKQC